MKLLIIALLTFTSFIEAKELKPAFANRYVIAAQDMTPFMDIKSCTTKKNSKTPDYATIECDLMTENSLLTIDVFQNKLNGIWLMYDASHFGHPSDTKRVGAMLLRAYRGTSPAGSHIGVTSELFYKSLKNNWQETCTIDVETKSELCISSTKANIFNLTINPQSAAYTN